MENKKTQVRLPEGRLCEKCSDGCRYWDSSDKDSNGRQYCGYYRTYYYPRERSGCLSFKK